ncbi:MAG: SMI1/KNR4 family protein [Ruminococcus sp.]|nr:SMI1/KNR4 family protein [Ruminococcus sp.]
MSKQNFDKAIKLVKKCEDFDKGGKKSPKIIEKAEQLLGLKFSEQESEYLSKFGYIEFSGVELYGILNEDFEDDGEYEGCMVEWTLHEREEGNIPEDWIALQFADDGGMIFLDHSDIDENGEPKVILAEDTGTGYKKTDLIADDFGNFLLGVVEEQLEEQ